MSIRPSVSVFFPAYNDAWTIASLLVTTDRLLRTLADDYEIIVVN
ncbi:MAG: glycosyltransferase family 2 protein, partial [Chloroflexi bacterium]|nr:glycosyltransferase family 2 protein [Chloroflexota bacterium]